MASGRRPMDHRASVRMRERLIDKTRMDQYNQQNLAFTISFCLLRWVRNKQSLEEMSSF